jgi:adenylate cyclase
LGFADPSTAGVKFSDADVQMISTIAVIAAMLPAETVEDLARVWGAGAQQTAHAAVNAMRVGFEQPLRADGGSEAEIEIAYGEIVNEMLPGVIEAWGTMFRHHVVASTYEDVAVSEDGFVQSQQTIAFVDLVDYTGFALRASAAELAAALSRFEKSVASIAGRHGGSVVKLLGDCVMLRFGIRSDAVEALRAIVAGGDGPSCRGGVATGRVLTRQGDFYGPVVNLASRLAAVVEPGEVGVDATVAVPNATLEAPVAIKGLDEPVAYYRLDSAGG